MTFDLTNSDSTSGHSLGGAVIHWAGRYDALVWLLTLGREESFRERLIAPAGLESGESVLDVGCGTGTLAILAKRRVGPTGIVHGVDPSPEMIERALKKASKAGADVAFRTGFVQALPFPHAHFDVVLSTLMMHHLSRTGRGDCVREVHRVLKPGGRVLVVDFGARPSGKKSLIGHFHRRGGVKLDALLSVLNDGGLDVIESGPVGMRNLFFALARRPAA